MNVHLVNIQSYNQNVRMVCPFLGFGDGERKGVLNLGLSTSQIFCSVYRWGSSTQIPHSDVREYIHWYFWIISQPSLQLVGYFCYMKKSGISSATLLKCVFSQVWLAHNFSPGAGWRREMYFVFFLFIFWGVRWRCILNSKRFPSFLVYVPFTIRIDFN